MRAFWGVKDQLRVRGTDAGQSVTRRRGIILKSLREIELMRVAGRLVHRVLLRVHEMTAASVTTAALSAEAERMIVEAGGTALFKGVENPQAKFPFPAALCTSVNEQLVHGIPNDRRLRPGDLVSVDCGVRLGGYCADSATTIAIEPISRETRRLIDVTRRALEVGIQEIRPGRMWSEVARKIQASIERERMAVVRDFVGHGIGREMHEEPKVPNYWDRKQKGMDFELIPNMVLAVEPMVNLGGAAVEYGTADRWVVVTKDGRCSAHFEHTVAVTPSGCDVLTDGR